MGRACEKHKTILRKEVKDINIAENNGYNKKRIKKRKKNKNGRI
jgi:pyocin large subunit-like protein